MYAINKTNNLKKDEHYNKTTLILKSYHSQYIKIPNEFKSSKHSDR